LRGLIKDKRYVNSVLGPRGSDRTEVDRRVDRPVRTGLFGAARSASLLASRVATYIEQASVEREEARAGREVSYLLVPTVLSHSFVATGASLGMQCRCNRHRTCGSLQSLVRTLC